MVDDSITSAIQNLETVVVQDDSFLDENTGHALETLCNGLEQIDDEPESHSIDQKRQLIVQLKSFEINLFRQWLLKFVPSIPASVLSNLFDAIRYQAYIDMEISESVNDSYFDLSLSCLTADVTIDYLLGTRPSTPIDDHFLRLFCKVGRRAMVNKTKRSCSITVSRKKTPTFFQLNYGTERLLRGCINYLNRHFRDNPMSDTEAAVFVWVQSVMDIVAFVPYFVNTGYPNMIRQWLAIEPSEATISIKSWRETVDLVHNLARHELGVTALNQLQAISILKTWKERYLSGSTSSNDENYKDILVVYYMSYALLLEPAVLKQEDTTDIHLALDHILDRTVQAFQFTSLRYGPYSVSEFLTALARFTVNDKCLLYILTRDNIFKLFVQKFLEFNQLFMVDTNPESTDLNILICSLLYTIFWSISFQSDYHAKLKTNTEFVRFVLQIIKIDSSDENVASIRRSANGILFNLDLAPESLVLSKSEIKDDTDGVKVMVSYSHKDTTFCQKLVSSLKDQVQGDLWVDFIKLEPPYEDDWEEIAEAVTHCDVVVMIVTANYCSSKSCRREVIHADKRNKRMIPVYQGSEYQPEDWFEIRAGSATWVRFGDRKSDEKVMETLVGLINAQEKTKKRSDQKADLEYNNSTPPVIIAPPVVDVLPPPLPHPVPPIIVPVSILTISPPLSTSTKPIEQWTSEEVQQWLRLPPSILQLSCGRALLAYARLISEEDAQRDEYERSLRDRGLSREQYANLISDLMTLRILHNVEATSKTPPKQWTGDELKCWFEQNNLSNYLLDTLAFVNGVELVTYAKLMIASPVRINAEYDRLRTRIQTRYNGQDLFQLDEYARFVSALRKTVERSQLSSELNNATGSCDIS